jgi:NADPH:quinone reductase-like Zn-dependent oxidoreductase
MKAVYAVNGTVQSREVPDPHAGSGEILVRVHAAGLNAADRYVIDGSHISGPLVRAPQVPAVVAPAPLGSEFAGEVVAVGDGVVSCRVGDRIMGTGGGTFAELTTVRDGFHLPVPDNLSWVEAAAVPVTFVSAHDALTNAGAFAPSDAVLVNAASSGVGVAALQLLKVLAAATVIASSTSQDKLDLVASAGLSFDVGVVAGEADFVDRCLQATAERGVDLILDSVGAPAMADNIAVSAIAGRIVSIGRMGGGDAEVNLHELSRKRISLIGTTFRTRSVSQLAAVFSDAASVLIPALADGRVRPIVDRVFSLGEAADAEAYLVLGKRLGKVVLDIS